MDEYDILIENATIVDGSGNSAYNGSIGIKGDRVVSLGDVKGDYVKVIDAKGLTAVPGFIDAHSHAETGLLSFPRCESFIHQGVTTFVGGQCSGSPAPIGDEIRFPGAARIHMDKLVKYKYYPEKFEFPREQVNAIMKEEYGWTVDWRTMGEYFDFVESRGFSVNYVPLVGHGTVRRYVMGDDWMRASTREERDEMSAQIRQALEEGCIGMSYGLDYDPDTFADREELVEHAEVLNEYGAVLCPHSRRTGRRRDVAAGHRQHDKIDGITEIIDIARASKVRMNIAHLFTGWYVNPQGGPEMLEEANRRATLTYIDAALEEGLDVSFDVIPPALPTKFGGSSYLCSLFLPFIRELGSREELAKWMKVKDFREEIKDSLKRGKFFIRIAYNPNTNPRWAENIHVLRHKDPKAVDKTLADIAEEREKDAFDVWMDLIAEDPDAMSAVGAARDPYANYHAIFYQHPVASVGLDTGVDDYKYVADTPTWVPPSISSYSAFVGFFDKFVNKMKALTLEEAVHKTSTQAAMRHNIKDRGVIKEGSYADIVLMDLPGLKVTGTPLDTRSKPKGIEYVIINGTPVVEKAEHTGAKPGRVLKRT
ncbi:MAG: amidohydrolase family protein [Candidatus Bathyarchaeota archaeon]|nr:amidohydrolase family protein [Candidatus Bathyarchaeota archaeon]